MENWSIKGNSTHYEKKGTLGTCLEAISEQIFMFSPVGTNSSLYGQI